MDEPLYFISMNPPLPLAGQIPVSWGPVKESDLQEYVEKFHLQGNYTIHRARLEKEFTVANGEKTEIKDITE